jgi:hypothetical protein
MKNIEITPEWILSGHVFDYYADGRGVVRFSTYTFSDSAWVSLALITLGINYET